MPYKKAAVKYASTIERHTTMLVELKLAGAAPQVIDQYRTSNPVRMREMLTAMRQTLARLEEGNRNHERTDEEILGTNRELRAGVRGLE